MKLRNMSAYVTEEKNITIVLASGEVLNLENAREMRKIAALGVDDVEKEYAFAARILECERLRNRIRSTFTMFATRNEVYSEFANAVLDEF